MRERMSGAGDYMHFKGHVPLHHIPVACSLCPSIQLPPHIASD